MTKVLIFTDVAMIAWSRTAGPYRIATQLRREGYTTQVVEHFLWASITNKQRIFDTIDRFVTKDTLCLGFSITFFQQTLIIPEAKKLVTFGNSLNVDLLKESSTPYAIPLNDEFIWEIKRRAKKNSPKIKFIIGGASKNKLDLSNTPFDAQVVGFADQSMPAYVKYLDGKNPFFNLGNGHIDYDQKASGFSIDSATIEWTDSDILIEGERLPIEISRGCIFKCKFCGYALNGKKKLDYTKAYSVLSKEMNNNYSKWGIKDYWFSDDTFNDTSDKVNAIHSVSKNLDFKINFRAYLRLDLLSARYEEIDLLTESGLDMAMFGIESLNHDNNKLVGKGMHPEKILSSLESLLTKNGWDKTVTVLTCLMVGLPFDTEKNLGWLDVVLSDSFKADYLSLNPLYLVQTASDLNASTFDKEASKYGYTFRDPWNWKNENTGMTFETACSIVNETLKKNVNKNKFGTLQEYHIGMPKSSLLDLSNSIYDSNIPQDRWKISNFLFKKRLALMDSYFDRLLRI